MTKSSEKFSPIVAGTKGGKETAFGFVACWIAVRLVGADASPELIASITAGLAGAFKIVRNIVGEFLRKKGIDPSIYLSVLLIALVPMASGCATSYGKYTGKEDGTEKLRRLAVSVGSRIDDDQFAAHIENQTGEDGYLVEFGASTTGMDSTMAVEAVENIAELLAPALTQYIASMPPGVVPTEASSGSFMTGALTDVLAANPGIMTKVMGMFTGR